MADLYDEIAERVLFELDDCIASDTESVHEQQAKAIAAAYRTAAEDLMVDHVRLPMRRDCGWYEGAGPGCFWLPEGCERCALRERDEKWRRLVGLGNHTHEMSEYSGPGRCPKCHERRALRAELMGEG